MTGHFERRGIESPRLVAELLLAHVVGCERLRLYMDADRPASPLELQTLRGLVERASAHEPVQYLLGEAWFFGLKFKVTRDTLIPRPSTEALVEHILQHQRVAPGFEAPTVADVGTGSGAIAVTVGARWREAHIVATDVSAPALEVAGQNASTHGVIERIEFREGSLFEPLERHPAWGRLDYLLSNPPYIPDHEWEEVAPNVRDHEPASALRGGTDGLDYLRPLIARAHEALRPGGHLAFEIAASQKAAALELARNNAALTDARVLADHEGFPRVLVASRVAR